jgi:hypothetical protein
MLHPLVLAILALDTVAALLLLAGAVVAVRVLIGWQPGDAHRAQLQLERRVESASLQGRLAWGLWLMATLIWGIAIAGVLPNLVPGAMCGTGVMEAMGGHGGRALALRLIALALLGGWHLIDRLDRSTPHGDLTEASARGLLLITPIALLSAWHTWGAFARLDTQQPVDCCAVVYDAVAGSGGLLHGHPPELWLWPTAIGAAMLLPLSLRAWRGRAGPMLGLLSPLWALVAGGALINVLAAYHYEVLHHHCPWCLFLAEHGRVGYPLFAALAVIIAEGGAAWIASRVAKLRPALAPAAHRRIRRAGIALMLALAVYAWLAVWPALAWRLSRGVWM